MHFLELPVEMLQYIAQFLPPSAIVNLGQTCRHLLDVTKIDSIWQWLCYRDYKVNSIDGWNLTHKEVYTKVLQKCGFLGWKRLALLPYGGLIFVSWEKGEIRVLKYQPKSEASPEDNLECHPLYSLQWNSGENYIEVQCLQCEDGPRPAVLTQGCGSMDGPLYPVVQCLLENCARGHTSALKYGCSSSRKFKKGFEDYPNAFNITFYKGSSCPLLPFPSWAEGDQAKSPVQLGLYAGDYGSHGVEILHLSISPDEPDNLLGLKVTGDPNVPAGYTSLTVHLNKPVVLTRADQEMVSDMLAADAAREVEGYGNGPPPNQEGGEPPDTRQPFAVPLDCFDRGQESPTTCLASFWKRMIMFVPFCIGIYAEIALNDNTNYY